MDQEVAIEEMKIDHESNKINYTNSMLNDKWCCKSNFASQMILVWHQYEDS